MDDPITFLGMRVVIDPSVPPGEVHIVQRVEETETVLMHYVRHKIINLGEDNG